MNHGTAILAVGRPYKAKHWICFSLVDERFEQVETDDCFE